MAIIKENLHSPYRKWTETVKLSESLLYGNCFLTAGLNDACAAESITRYRVRLKKGGVYKVQEAVCVRYVIKDKTPIWQSTKLSDAGHLKSLQVPWRFSKHSN